MAVLFAPILRNTQPAFLANSDSIKIYYTLPLAASLKDIKTFEAKVNQQDTNANIIKDISGVAVIQPQSSYLVLSKSNFKEGHWQKGKLYKIQIRGVDQNGNKSEWSNVMITKAITAPQVDIANREIAPRDLNEISAVYTERELMPVFYGKCIFANGESEWLNTYQFDLRKNGELVESSGSIQYDSSSSTAPSYRFKRKLSRNELYSVVFSIVSNNGYTETSESYDFKVIPNEEGTIKNTTLNVDCESIACKENAMIKLYLTSDSLIGDYVIVRSDEDSNYEVWEDVKNLTFAIEQLEHKLIYTDFTIDCGKKYKYALQMVNKSTLKRSEMLLPEETGPFLVNFEYSYLCGNGTQIKLNLNSQISSFRHTRLQTKQDTLGARLPTILQNGYAYYAEFPISGLISAYMDEENLFMNKDFGDYRRTDVESNKILSTSQTSSTIVIEREFRHKVETFLNDGEYKLFKTPTETDKNIIVALVGVSLSPVTSLNRMLYSFSATAYEVAENTLNNLNELGINPLGEWKDLSKQSSIRSFGQLNGDYGEGAELYNEIQKQEEQNYGNYKYEITNLRQLKLSNIDNQPTSIAINGQKVSIAKNRQYALTNLQESDITSVRLLKPASLLVDYTLDKTLQPVAEGESQVQYLLRDWGQIQRQPVEASNIDILALIIKDSLSHFDSNATLQEDDTYIYTKDGETIVLKFDGIETIQLRNAEGAELEINGNKVYVGNTSVYRLQPIEDGLQSVILIKDMPLLIDYKLKIYKTIIQGG